MPNKREKIRRIEVLTGLILIISILGMLAAFILSFDYTIPNTSFEEDMEFLIESYGSQQLSAVSWLIAGISYLFLLPFYLILFARFQKGMHIFNGLLILVMAYMFFSIGLSEYRIAEVAGGLIGNENPTEKLPAIQILENIRQIKLFHRIGLTAFGTFATILSISRFKKAHFPVLGSTLAFIAGPLVVTFNWINPDSILLTGSLAVAWTGLLIIGARLTNKGFIYQSK